MVGEPPLPPLGPCSATVASYGLALAADDRCIATSATGSELATARPASTAIGLTIALDESVASLTAGWGLAGLSGSRSVLPV
jgi:hypothetical protein